AIINGWLVRGLGENFTVRCQLPVIAYDDTEPEPDFAVLAGSAESQRDHPNTALLMIEVADSSLAHDRRKADIYAARGVADYWIVNLPNRQLEVFRTPAPSAESLTGVRYSSKSILTLEQSIVPLSLSLAPVKVSRLFPAAA
ncbi:MAG TPA: Uma2 family endonuclease, partial [Phycisphaerae bacterium]